MKILHKMNIRRIIGKQHKDTMVVVKSDKYGFIWAGKAKFVFTNFRNEFFNLFPECASRDSTGALVITIK